MLFCHLFSNFVPYCPKPEYWFLKPPKTAPHKNNTESRVLFPSEFKNMVKKLDNRYGFNYSLLILFHTFKRLSMCWFLRSFKFLSTVPYKSVPYKNDTECIQGLL